jgi:hypothetical protein
MLGDALRSEVEDLLVRRDTEKPISTDYLSTIGRVTLDQRLSLLHDVRVKLGSEPDAPSFMAVFAGFGPLLRSCSIEGEAYIPDDVYGEAPLPSLPDSVLILCRGKVPFNVMAARAQESGAKALIVLQSYPIWPFVMTSSSVYDSLAIPVVMMSSGDGDILRRIVQQVTSLRITLRFNELSTECAICQEDIASGAVVLRLPACGHAYHESCVLSWLQKQNTCPLCRKAMPKQESAEESKAASLGEHAMVYYS